MPTPRHSTGQEELNADIEEDISLLHIPLEALREEHINRVCADEVPEGARLEFKQELALGSKGQRLEIAKDISAMANAVGGRIVYGIAEKEQPDGSHVASRIAPLIDGTIQQSLENIIATTVSPHLRCRIQRVDVTRGFCMIVEVYPSSGRDLYMVSGYDEQRFYMRGEQSVRRMTEAEIREAYRRIAASTLQLEAAIEEAISEESSIRSAAQESVVIVPWYATRNLADPRLIARIGDDLGKTSRPPGPMAALDLDLFITNMRVGARGLLGLHHYSSREEERGSPRSADHYFAIARSGLVHYSRKSVPSTQGDGLPWQRPRSQLLPSRAAA